MLDFCERIVEKMGSSWGTVGWALFVLFLVSPFFIAAGAQGQASNAGVWLIPISCGALLLAWWVIDAVDQQVAPWKVLVGLVMLGIGCLPRGGILTIAAWVIYWLRVRE